MSEPQALDLRRSRSGRRDGGEWIVQDRGPVNSMDGERGRSGPWSRCGQPELEEHNQHLPQLFPMSLKLSWSLLSSGWSASFHLLLRPF